MQSFRHLSSLDVVNIPVLFVCNLPSHTLYYNYYLGTIEDRDVSDCVIVLKAPIVCMCKCCCLSDPRRSRKTRQQDRSSDQRDCWRKRSKMWVTLDDEYQTDLILYYFELIDQSNSYTEICRWYSRALRFRFVFKSMILLDFCTETEDVRTSIAQV